MTIYCLYLVKYMFKLKTLHQNNFNSSVKDLKPMTIGLISTADMCDI